MAGGLSFVLRLMALAFIAVAPLKIKEAKADVPPSIGSSLSLLKEPVFLLAVVGIFLYVGAEASMCRFLSPALVQLGFAKKSADTWILANTWGPSLFLLMLTIGRIGGGAASGHYESPHLFSPVRRVGIAGADYCDGCDRYASGQRWSKRS